MEGPIEIVTTTTTHSPAECFEWYLSHMHTLMPRDDNTDNIIQSLCAAVGDTWPFLLRAVGPDAELGSLFPTLVAHASQRICPIEHIDGDGSSGTSASCWYQMVLNHRRRDLWLSTDDDPHLFIFVKAASEALDARPERDSFSSFDLQVIFGGCPQHSDEDEDTCIRAGLATFKEQFPVLLALEILDEPRLVQLANSLRMVKQKAASLQIHGTPTCSKVSTRRITL